MRESASTMSPARLRRGTEKRICCGETGLEGGDSRWGASVVSWAFAAREKGERLRSAVVALRHTPAIRTEFNRAQFMRVSSFISRGKARLMLSGFVAGLNRQKYGQWEPV